MDFLKNYLNLLKYSHIYVKLSVLNEYEVKSAKFSVLSKIFKKNIKIHAGIHAGTDLKNEFFCDICTLLIFNAAPVRGC